MKSGLFIRNLLIIIVTLLALNIVLPTLSNPATSCAAKNIEYKVIDFSEYWHKQHATEEGLAGLLEKLFNEYSKEGWEYIDNASGGALDSLMIFKR